MLFTFLTLFGQATRNRERDHAASQEGDSQPGAGGAGKATMENYVCKKIAKVAKKIHDT